MLPTPDTSHVPFSRVYEPAEDSYLLLDTLSSASETAFLHSRFALAVPPPLVLEVGSGSGVVISFVHAHAATILGTRAVLTAAVDANPYACAATRQTVRVAEQPAHQDAAAEHGVFLDAVTADLTSALRPGLVDVLVFNPPYVPTEELPAHPASSACCRRDSADQDVPQQSSMVAPAASRHDALSYDDESYLLSLSYAGGRDGMEVTDRLIASLPEVLSPRGCAYILLCARNWPDQVKSRIVEFGPEWRAETVGTSGKQGGWEKLQIIRAWREFGEES